jgi:hypothetical protein
MEWPLLISPCIPMYPHVQTIQIHVIRIWNKRPSHEHPQSFGLGPWPPPGQLVACCLFSGAKDSLVTLACSKHVNQKLVDFSGPWYFMIFLPISTIPPKLWFHKCAIKSCLI